MASFARDNDSYERWLREKCDVVEDDLRAKHTRMRRSPFDFLRATYFRWAQTIESLCPEFAKAPRTLCVGDIHVENYGTWRDAQSRLVWGINDFDEAASMPYAYDLIRLATSARLAGTLCADPANAASAIAAGYLAGLRSPRPALLDEDDHWLQALVAESSKASRDFWRDVDEWPAASPPPKVRRALERSLPDDAEVLRFATRTRGGGSLGRPRFLVIARWRGGSVVREAKALVPSAWHWAHPKTDAKSRVLELAFGPYRAPDPEVKVKAGYVLRRIAPDSHKVELADVAGRRLDEKLLAAMGAELGAVHAAGRRHAQILRDVDGRDGVWLSRAAEVAEQVVQNDFRQFSSSA